MHLLHLTPRPDYPIFPKTMVIWQFFLVRYQMDLDRSLWNSLSSSLSTPSSYRYPRLTVFTLTIFFQRKVPLNHSSLQRWHSERLQPQQQHSCSIGRFFHRHIPLLGQHCLLPSLSLLSNIWLPFPSARTSCIFDC